MSNEVWIAKDDDDFVYLYEYEPIKTTYGFSVSDGQWEEISEEMATVLIGRELKCMECIKICVSTKDSTSKSLEPSSPATTKRKKHR